MDITYRLDETDPTLIAYRADLERFVELRGAYLIELPGPYFDNIPSFDVITPGGDVLALCDWPGGIIFLNRDTQL